MAFAVDFRAPLNPFIEVATLTGPPPSVEFLLLAASNFVFFIFMHLH